ncbi:hypothetical protein VTO42DRAFT_7444 [Malbranchea cinnamomea]
MTRADLLGLSKLRTDLTPTEDSKMEDETSPFPTHSPFNCQSERLELFAFAALRQVHPQNFDELLNLQVANRRVFLLLEERYTSPEC